ncbi:hypothetical protein [Nocardioides sp.]|uniref:hypothetical protein n=1 Tax=Nocardioides sp. TaxID=35761 RepID=UPI0035183F83
MLVPIAAVVLVALAVGIWAYTGPIADARARDRAERAEAAAEAAEATRLEVCEDELQESYDSLSELDSRLDVGVTQSDFGGFVGDAQVLFDQIDSDVVEANSCAAYEEMEAAIAIYIATNSAWNDCIFDDYCDPDTDLSLGSDWVTASEHLDRAADGGLGRADGEPA